MRQPVSKMPFYRSRSLGEKFNDAADFIRENLRPWLACMTLVLLPLAILRGFEVNSMLGQLTGRASADAAVGWAMAGAMLSMLLINVVNWTLVRLYVSRPEGLRGLSWAEVRPEARSMLLRMTRVGLVVLLIFCPVFLLVLVFTFTLPVLSLVLLLWLPWVTLLAPVYAFERVTLGEAVRRAYRLGRSGWGALVGLLLMLGVVMLWAGLAQSLPMALAYSLFSDFFSDAAMSSMLYHVGRELSLYAVAVLLVFVNSLLTAYGVLVIGMHYASVADDTYDASVAHDIENFENL